jgi:ankyrin repeat protein
MNKYTYIKYKVYNLNGGATINTILSQIRDGIIQAGVIPIKTNGWKKYNKLNKVIHKLNNTIDINNPQFINSTLLSFNINRQNNIYIEPLHFAIINNYTDMLDIKKYTPQDLNRTNYFGLTPLLLATHQNNLDIVNKLITNGVDVNFTPPNQKSPYQYALSKNYNNIAIAIQNVGGT